MKGYQFVMCAKQHSSSTITPFGLPEVRLACTGAFLVVGIPQASLAPAGHAEKVAVVNSMDVETFVELAKRFGFVSMVHEGSLLSIPAGFMVATFMNSTDAVSFVRWSIFHASQKPVVLETVQGMLQAYPMLQGSDYKPWADMLSA